MLHISRCANAKLICAEITNKFLCNKHTLSMCAIKRPSCSWFYDKNDENLVEKTDMQQSLVNQCAASTDQFGTLTVRPKFRDVKQLTNDYMCLDVPSTSEERIPSLITRSYDLSSSVHNHFDLSDEGYDLCNVLIDSFDSTIESYENVLGEWIIDESSETIDLPDSEFIWAPSTIHCRSIDRRRTKCLRERHLASRFIKIYFNKRRFSLYNNTSSSLSEATDFKISEYEQVGNLKIDQGKSEMISNIYMEQQGIHDLKDAEQKLTVGEIMHDTRAKILFQPDKTRQSEMSVQTLKHLLSNKDINGLRLKISSKLWPKFHLLKSLISPILRLFVEKSEDLDEIITLLNELSLVDRRIFLNELDLLHFLERAVVEKGFELAREYAKICRKLFSVREPVVNSKTRRSVEISLLTAVQAKARKDLSNAIDFVENLIEMRYIFNTSHFIRSLVEMELDGNDFEKAFEFARDMAHRYRTTEHIHVLLGWILSQPCSIDTKVETMIREVLAIYDFFNNPLVGIAEFIVELVKKDYMDEAKMLFNSVDIPGDYFCIPLQKLSKTNVDISCVEKMAGLISDCLFPRVNKKEKAKSSPTDGFENGHCLITNVEVKSFTSTSNNLVQFLLNDWSRSKRQKQFSFNKKPRKKISIDADCLEILIMCMQKVWADLAVKSSDINSLKKLCYWSQRHGLLVETDILNRYNELNKLTRL